MDHLPLIGTVAAAHLLGAMSPGPDFVLALRNSLRHGRAAGVWTACGFGLGVAVHAAYCAAGLAFLIARTPLLFLSLQLVGAFYLAWVGGISLFAEGDGQDTLNAGLYHSLYEVRNGTWPGTPPRDSGNPGPGGPGGARLPFPP